MLAVGSKVQYWSTTATASTRVLPQASDYAMLRQGRALGLRDGPCAQRGWVETFPLCSSSHAPWKPCSSQFLDLGYLDQNGIWWGVCKDGSYRLDIKKRAPRLGLCTQNNVSTRNFPQMRASLQTLVAYSSSLSCCVLGELRSLASKPSR